MPATKPLLSELLRKVREKLDRDNLSIADLARAIGKPRNYHQVHAWIIGQVAEPKAEITLRLQAWQQGDTAALAKSISQKASGASDGAAANHKQSRIKSNGKT